MTLVRLLSLGNTGHVSSAGAAPAEASGCTNPAKIHRHLQELPLNWSHSRATDALSSAQLCKNFPFDGPSTLTAKQHCAQCSHRDGRSRHHINWASLSLHSLSLPTFRSSPVSTVVPALGRVRSRFGAESVPLSFPQPHYQHIFQTLSSSLQALIGFSPFIAREISRLSSLNIGLEPDPVNVCRLRERLISYECKGTLHCASERTLLRLLHGDFCHSTIHPKLFNTQP